MRHIISVIRLVVSAMLISVISMGSSLAQVHPETAKSLKPQVPKLQNEVLERALSTYQCAYNKGLVKQHYLTVVDFNLPSNEKRLWLFDLKKKKLILKTWVAHGINSGDLYAKYFSNEPNAHKSSLGLYVTNSTYIGKHGLSLRIRGAEKGFNDKAYSRSVVVHGAWYVSPSFVKKYGRIGRSWGCPAVPQHLSSKIVKIIKDGSIILVHYKDHKWLSNSKFVNCK